MNVNTFIDKLLDCCSHKTLYVMGCFGAPLNKQNKPRYKTNYKFNMQPIRQKMIDMASDDTFGFDCVCLIKGILWGWNGDKDRTYGGAKYASNGVPDIDANYMFTKCSNQSTDFSIIKRGEAVWMKDHIGVYIGDGEVVECTPAFKNCVQVTKLAGRGWVKHGFLPYIEYEQEKEPDVEKALDLLKQAIKILENR